MPVQRLEIETRAPLPDALAIATQTRLKDWLGLEVGGLTTRKVYHLDLGLSEAEAEKVLQALCDPVAERGSLGMLPDSGSANASECFLSVGFRPGVTDTVGATVKRAAEDCLGRKLEGRAYSSQLYCFSGCEESDVQRAADKVLVNPLIQRMRLESGAQRQLDLEVPKAGSSTKAEVRSVALGKASDVELEEISLKGMLALSLQEMKVIQEHFNRLGRDPKDAELECIAQTWSEHCKHKIFASPIAYQDPEGQSHQIEKGLFRSKIRGATEAIAQERKAQGVDGDKPFLVSVFHDNAGVVRFTEADHLVYKVETHNSPSALDPYGGAMTGIVGVNRDSFGTGLGADLLTNVWGYCFGDPRYDAKKDGELPKGLMHPRRIRDGVHEGVIDGGNHSGIPYSRGFELFDERYLGKPLVYCGTVAAMPVESAGRPSEQKEVEVGDHIVMVGGRIGKDGIHGATFSSVELDDDSPVQAVQIGDPITQRMMFDFLAEARELGLYSGFTDNGAGGLSSSVGEMAELTGGAKIDLAKAPLKYPGLAPWEILISEAQERMTVAVRPEKLQAFLDLARRREVEASELGVFTDSGRLEVLYADQSACDLDLSFLHDGVPLPTLKAVWSPPKMELLSEESAPAKVQEKGGLSDCLLEFFARPNLSADESKARHYDHEVKGLSVIKPYLGVRGDVPATATVMRVRHQRREGVVLGEGIHPFYSDLDTREMALACVDEGVRRVLCAGARFDRLSALDNFCWPDPIESSKTPDGAHKLAQLVRTCEGLYDACLAFGVPLISGKDSMKNDANLGGVKISIPPTLLVSVMGQMENVASALTLEPRGSGDRIYLLGQTKAELGGSEFSRMFGGGRERNFSTVPQTNLAENRERYLKFESLRDQGMVRSAHALGRGGLALALSHMALSCDFTLECDLSGMGLPVETALFSESTGRIVITVREEDVSKLESHFNDGELFCIGRVEAMSDDTCMRIRGKGGTELCKLRRSDLRNASQETLHGL